MRKIFINIILALLIYPNFTWGQITIDQFTSGSLFSYAQDRIVIFGNQMSFIGENSEMKPIYLENGTQKGDTFFYKFNDYKTESVLPYTFVIKKFGIDSALITPISQAARDFYSQRNQIKFYNRKYFCDNSISFESLFFSLKPNGSHFADGITLEIDSNRNLKLKFLSAYNDAESGNYKGKLTEDGYSQLIKFLRTDNINTLFWPNSEYYGQDSMKLILYFNKKRKVLTAKGNTPYLTANLILFFKQIRKLSVLEKTNQDLVMEDK